MLTTRGLGDSPLFTVPESPVDDDGMLPRSSVTSIRSWLDSLAAETADEGLDAIRQHHPDAAIIDLRLKRGSGREVVVSMPPDVPVIIFSGLRSESADLEVIRPRTRLVEKPYSLIMLMDTLEDMLEQSRAQ